MAFELQIVNLAELAELADRSVNAVREWIRRGLPADKDATGEFRIDLGNAVRWLAQRRPRTENKGSKGAIERQRARKLAAEADLAEIDLEQKRGELVPVALVAKDHAESIARARTILVAIGTKLAPICAAETDIVGVRNAIDAEVHRALAELARPSRGLRGGDEPGGPGLGAAAAADGQRVGGQEPNAIA